MSPQRWEKIKQLFHTALEKGSAERAAFLTEACVQDPELRAEVERLISEHEKTTTFLQGCAPGAEWAGVVLGLNPALANPHDDSRRDIADRSGPPRQAGTTIAEVSSSVGLKIKERYVLQRELGRGGFGVVYLASDEQLLSRSVVIKVLLQRPQLDAWSRKKFRQEIEALARIDHPGVVGVLDSGELPDGRPYLVMQYVDGCNLRSVMKAQGMDFERIAAIIRQVGSALSAAHEKGVYHRDLKPENIMLQQLGEDEHAKLIDFGIATVLGSRTPGSTPETMIVGSRAYMAPEQIMGRPSALSDIYALGVIAYEMVTGRTPFHSNSSAHLYSLQMAGIKIRAKDLRPDLSEGADEIILKALSAHPHERHQRASEFARDMVRALTACVESDRAASPALEIGHVVSIDLLEHWRMSMDQQMRQVKLLQELVRGLPAMRAVRASDFVRMSMASGMVLVSFWDPVMPVQIAVELMRAVQSGTEIKVRAGLHSGPVYTIKDIESRKHVAGDGVMLA